MAHSATLISGRLKAAADVGEHLSLRKAPHTVEEAEATRLDAVRAILVRRDLSAESRLVAIALVTAADTSGVAEVSTADLQRRAGLERKTVLRATAALRDRGLIEMLSRPGQRGRFQVLPEPVDAAPSGPGTGAAVRHLCKISAVPPCGTSPSVRPVLDGTGPAYGGRSGAATRHRFTVAPLARAHATTESLRDTPPHLESLPHTLEQEAPRAGEEHIGQGVFVNCETIRHRQFEISLKGIQLQLCGAVPMATIKSIAQGHALQWALDLGNGKPVDKVVPSNTASFIRASIQRQNNEAAVTDVRKRKAGGASSNRMSLSELSDAVDSVFDRSPARANKQNLRLTDER